MKLNAITLTAAAPQQILIRDDRRRNLAMVRVRNGGLTVEAPASGGEVIYSTDEIDGDGMLTAAEYDSVMETVQQKVMEYYGTAYFEY